MHELQLNSPDLELNSMEIQAEETRSIDPVSCGICLSDGGGATIRGIIDCCDHFFCYVCILEWAKLESRCPLCKRRFSTICRPPKPPVFPSERIVKVAHRDQVYHLFGNSTTTRTGDPYGDVECGVCHGKSDEFFLLLCDLCDSAAHTYCVGLGKTVPEGDWFCSDCSVSREEHKGAEVDNESENENIEENAGMDFQADGNVDILDIVRDSDFPFSEHARRRRSTLLVPSQSLPSAVQENGCSSANQATPFGTRCRHVLCQPSVSVVRTMHVRRNVQNRIQALRENWDALRSGSLSFSSSSVMQGCECSKRRRVASGFQGKSDELRTSSSVLQGSTANGFSSGDTISTGNFSNIRKAWKMMDIAKSNQQNPRRTSNTNQAHKVRHSKNNSLRKAADVGAGLCILSSQQHELSNWVNMGSKKNEDHHRNETLKLDNKRKRIMDLCSSSRVLTGSSLLVCESSSAKEVNFATNVNFINGIRPGLKCNDGASSCSTNNHGKSVGSSSLLCSMRQGSSDACDAKAGLITGCSSKVDLSARKFGPTCDNGNSRREDDAKKEIQSLVKLNLKLLSNGKQLGADVFKAIARLATHTILAACGLDHSKSCVVPFRNFVCSHSAETKQRHKSTLMANSCRECFYVFVKDVVAFLVVDRVGRTGLNS